MGLTSRFALRIRGVTSREDFDRLEQSAKERQPVQSHGKTFAKEGDSHIVTLSFADPSTKRRFLKALKAELVGPLNTWTATDSFDGLTVLTSPLEPDLEQGHLTLDDMKLANSVM